MEVRTAAEYRQPVFLRVLVRSAREQAQAYIINPLINPLSGKQFQFRNLFQTHPPTENRIARLRSKEWAR